MAKQNFQLEALSNLNLAAEKQGVVDYSQVLRGVEGFDELAYVLDRVVVEDTMAVTMAVDEIL